MYIKANTVAYQVTLDINRKVATLKNGFDFYRTLNSFQNFIRISQILKKHLTISKFSV